MEPWLATLISIISSTAITTIIGILIKRSFDKYFRTKEAKELEQKAKDAKLKEYEDEKLRQERKEDVLESVGEIIKPVIEKLDTVEKKLDTNSVGTVTLLRDRMKTAYDCYKDRGYSTESDKANWNELYLSYKNLGGNHFKEYVDQWKHTVDTLPNKPRRQKLNEKAKESK